LLKNELIRSARIDKLFWVFAAASIGFATSGIQHWLNARDAVKALIVANEFLEAQVRELQAAVSHGCPRSGLSRSDFVHWHFWDLRRCPV
jgi:hypothetical protein